MGSNGDLPLTYPPDIYCFTEGYPYWFPSLFEENNCSVTENMVNFLNLSGTVIDVKPYLTVYCLNPPADDDCPFGFCPNPDIAGPLVRIASGLAPAFSVLSCIANSSPDYVTGLCIGEPLLFPDARSLPLLIPSSSNSHLLLAKGCQGRLLVPGPYHLLPPAHLRGLPHPGGTYPIPRRRPDLYRMLARQCILRGVLHPGLLEYPPS